MGDNPKRYRVSFTDTGRLTQVEWTRRNDFNPEVRRQAEEAARRAAEHGGLFSQTDFSEAELRIVLSTTAETLRRYLRDDHPEVSQDERRALLRERYHFLKTTTLAERYGHPSGHPSRAVIELQALETVLSEDRKETQTDEE